MTGPTTLEIERRFLVASVSPQVRQRASRARDIRQAYLTRGKPAVRVREIGDEYLMTVKDGTGLVRREVEFAIEPDLARALFEIGHDRTISKTRYDVGRWEIDVFVDRFEGLLIAEVELESAEEPLPDVPDGVAILCEVTDRGGFTNQHLAYLDEHEARALVAGLLSDHTTTLDALERRHAREGG